MKTLFHADGASCDGEPVPVTPLASNVVTVACGGPGRHVLELRARR